MGTETSQASEEGLLYIPFRLGYRKSLDGLRGVSIVLVLMHHSMMVQYVCGGSVGVEIFFVLSGFLITALLCAEWEKTGSISLSGFYGRRALRLLPVLVTFLMTALLIS